MQDLIKKSNFSILFNASIFVFVCFTSWQFMLKSNWHLSLVFFVSATSFLAIDIFNHSFLNVGKKIISQGMHLYIKDNSNKTLQIKKVLYFSKFFILLKNERKFLNLVPIWFDSVSSKDWHWLRLKTSKELF